MRIHPKTLLLSKRLLLFLPIPPLVALSLFLLTLSHSVYPGVSASLTAASVGLISPSGADHPIYAVLARAVANWISLFSLPVRLNLISVVCGTLCVAFFYHLVSRLIFFLACFSGGGGQRTEYGGYDSAPEMPQEVHQDNKKLIWVSAAAALLSCFLLVFLAPFWSAATRAHFALFDLLLAVSAFDLLLTCDVAETRYGRYLLLASSLFLFTMGLFDSAAFLLLLPCYLFFIAYFLLYASHRKTLFYTLVLVGVAGAACSLCAFFANTSLPVPKGLYSILLVSTAQFASHHYHELLSFFPRTGWVLIFLQTGAPALILLFGAARLFRLSAYGKLSAVLMLTAFALPSLLNLSIAPYAFYQHIDRLPVFASAFAAAGIGFALAACLKLLLAPPEETASPDEANDPVFRERERKRKGSSVFAAITLAAIGAQIPFVPWRSFFDVDNRVCAFADIISRELVQTMGARTCLVSNGYLDNHLLIQAFLIKHPLKLVTIAPGSQNTRELFTWVAETPLFNDLNRVRLQNALSISTVRFIMEWFKSDPQVTERAVAFASPDLWIACGYRAIPEGLGFGGVGQSAPPPNPKTLANRNQAFAEKIAPLLQPPKHENQQLANLRRILRMKASFASNELGILLEEANLPEEAFQAYSCARQIDPLNLSANINCYALASAKKIHPESIDRLRRNIRSLSSDNQTHNLSLMGILQTYGSIRQPDFYRQQASAWSAKGDASVAADKIAKAMDLSKEAGVSALIDNAMFYLQAGSLEKAEACCQAALEKDPANAAAMAAMSTLAISANKVEEAEKWLSKAKQNGAQGNMVLYQSIVLAMLRKDNALALRLLAKATQDNPNDQRYWLLYADQLLKENATQEVEFKVLPAMQKALNSPNHYLVHTMRGFLLRKKGNQYLKEARLELLRALNMNTLLPDVWHILFDADLAIGNPAFIESDAKFQLAVEPDNALANYLMGTCCMSRNALKESEDFFRRSIEKHPTAPACNDLSENLRRQQRLTEAEAFARQALSIQSDFAPALDTLACILVDGGKADDALPFAEKANGIAPRTPAFQLTLLSIRVKQNDQAEVAKLMNELSRSKTPIPEKLQKEIQALNQKRAPTPSPENT